jgi:nucleotide-binding universal stress UspA family protein
METTLKTILAATDGSATGDRAVTFAATLARMHGSALLLFTAIDRTAAIAACASPYGSFNGGEVMQSLDTAAAGILDRAARLADAAQVPSTKLQFSGPAAEAIVSSAAQCRADAIVVGTQGKRGLERLFVGSTAADVLRHSDVPVFVVPPHNEDEHVRSRRILVAVDESEQSQHALRFALDLAETQAATLLLCNAVDTRDLYKKAATYGYDPAPILAQLRGSVQAMLERRAELAEDRDLAHEIVIVNGEPARAIAGIATSRNVDSIVIGTHGRHGLQRLFLGSVAEGVVQRATVPVAVIRNGKAVGSRAEARRPELAAARG